MVGTMAQALPGDKTSPGRSGEVGCGRREEQALRCVHTFTGRGCSVALGAHFLSVVAGAVFLHTIDRTCGES